MPFIEVSVARGRTPEQLRALLEALHDGARNALDAPPESIRVILREVDPAHWLSGTQTLEEKQRSAR